MLATIHMKYLTLQSGQKNIFTANGNDKKVGIAILIASKRNFKRNVIRKDKERLCVMIKGFICVCAC